jgi:ABC-type multidrug transport system ATPase subunit
VLEIQELVKRYPNGTEALKGLSLTVEPGEVFGILGPNGAGKTTLLKILLGVLLPSSGRVSLEGICPAHAPMRFRQLVGVVHQFGSFDLELPVMDNLLIFGAFHGLSRRAVRDRATYLLDRFEVSAKAREPIRQLSGGQLGRVRLVRALLHRPKFLFLDEPTAGLDAFSRWQTWTVILEERSPSSYILCASHRVDEIERNCKKVMILDKGTVVALGTPEDLVASVSGHRLEFKLDTQPSDALLASLRTLPSVTELSSSDSMLRLRVSDTGATMAKVMESCFEGGVRVNSVVTKQASLEDVLLKTTGRELV